MKKIRVLIVDDSAIVRKLLTEAISAHADLEVVGTAPDAYVARDKILQLKPDVLTLDIEMPRMDGLTFLHQLMKHHPVPAVIISSLCKNSAEKTVEALRFGAVEVIAKPGGPYSVGELTVDLATKIRVAAAARIRPQSTSLVQPSMASSSNGAAKRVDASSAPSTPSAVQHRWNPHTVIAIGASTGGTEAIRQVLSSLPANAPPIIITQHIPALFSRAFADRLAELCPFEVKEAEDGDAVRFGRALIAPGNFHMVLRRYPDGLRVQIKDGPAVCYSRPSVDVMFSSVAEVAGAHATGVILTGMGADGAQGMLKMKRAGASTIAQDEESSVVFGMPREAVRLGGVDRTLPLGRIADAIVATALLRAA